MSLAFSLSVGAELELFQGLGWRLRVTKPYTLTVLYFGKVHEAEWLTEVQRSLPCLCGLVLLDNDYILHPIYAVLYTYILYIYMYIYIYIFFFLLIRCSTVLKEHFAHQLSESCGPGELRYLVLENYCAQPGQGVFGKL